MLITLLSRVVLVEEAPAYPRPGGWEGVTFTSSSSEEFVFQLPGEQQDVQPVLVVWTENGLAFVPTDEVPAAPHLPEDGPPPFAPETPWVVQAAYGSDDEFSAPHLSDDQPVYLWPTLLEAWTVPASVVDEAAPTQSTPDDAAGVTTPAAWETWVWTPSFGEDFVATAATTQVFSEDAPSPPPSWTDNWVPSIPVDVDFSAPHLADEPIFWWPLTTDDWVIPATVGTDCVAPTQSTPDDATVAFWPVPWEYWTTPAPVDEAAPTQSTPDDATVTLQVAWADDWRAPVPSDSDFVAPHLDEDAGPQQLPAWSDSWTTPATADSDFVSPHLADDAAPQPVLAWVDSWVIPGLSDAEFSAPYIVDDAVPLLPPMWVDAWRAPHVESEVLPGSSAGHTDFAPGIFNLFPVTIGTDFAQPVLDDRRMGGGVGNFLPYVSPADPRALYRRLFPRRPLEGAPLGSAGASKLQPAKLGVLATDFTAAGATDECASVLRVETAPLGWGAKGAADFSAAEFDAVAPRVTSVGAAAIEVPGPSLLGAQLQPAAAADFSLTTGRAEAPRLTTSGSTSLQPAVVAQTRWIAEHAPPVTVPRIDLTLPDLLLQLEPLDLVLEDLAVPDLLKRAA